MTEKEFWVFFNKSLMKNRVKQVSGCANSDNKIEKNIIVEMGELNYGSRGIAPGKREDNNDPGASSVERSAASP